MLGVEVSMATIAESMALATQYLQARNFAYAEQLLRQVLQAAPSETEDWRRLGTAVQAQGRVDEAIDYYREAVRLRPNYSEASIDLGIAYANRGRLEEAVRTFHEAVERVP